VAPDVERTCDQLVERNLLSYPTTPDTLVWALHPPDTPYSHHTHSPSPPTIHPLPLFIYTSHTFSSPPTIHTSHTLSPLTKQTHITQIFPLHPKYKSHTLSPSTHHTYHTHPPSPLTKHTSHSSPSAYTNHTDSPSPPTIHTSHTLPLHTHITHTLPFHTLNVHHTLSPHCYIHSRFSHSPTSIAPQITPPNESPPTNMTLTRMYTFVQCTLHNLCFPKNEPHDTRAQ